MKVLLDENMPHRLRHELPTHDVYTVAYMRWAGTGNGELLRLAAAGGFDVMITNDRGLEYQQHQAALPLSIIVLRTQSNTFDAIVPLCPELREILHELKPRQFTVVGLEE